VLVRTTGADKFPFCAFFICILPQAKVESNDELYSSNKADFVKERNVYFSIVMEQVQQTTLRRPFLFC